MTNNSDKEEKLENLITLIDFENEDNEFREYEFHPIADIFPLVSEDECYQLMKDIAGNGLLEPIVLFEGKILDGRNRYNAIELIEKCNLTLDKFRGVEFKGNKKQALYFVKSKNLHRRHLDIAQRSESALKFLKHEKEIGRKKRAQLFGRSKNGKPITRKDLSVSSTNGETEDTEPHDSWKNATNEFNISMDTLSKWKKITDVAQKDEKIATARDKALAGDRSISGVYLEVIRKEKPKTVPKLPKGEFSVILADPPWKYDFERSPTRAVENHYPTMEIEDICELKVPAAKNSILFLWVTMPKIAEGLRVLRSWGFTYKTGFIWQKPGIGLGYYVRGIHELVFIGTKGSIGVPEPGDRPLSIFIAPKTKHSKKPDKLYEIIEQMYPNQKYLELFARETREDWESWGAEI